ncbi:helix-turn-helix domain-containing protein [Halorussus litoreus]|uniref:helix-turn-helix domain-containing protein n=1 Tax=Halorussus litoreus TaxID=1710536 RepID=UPI000E224959|nr:helix-turn-helix domain-containing protein [Halorussus litoreus]
MRYLTVRLEPTADSAFHPVGKRLADEPSIQREAIHHIELLAGETVLTLAEGSGNRQRYEQLMSESPHVEEALVAGDDRWLATSQFTAQGPVQQLLEWRRESDLVVETPIPINDDGSMRITYLGDEADFQELYDKAVEATSLGLEVVETGEYDPDVDAFMRCLTSRQQEVLQAAVEVGYYREPRSATHEDVAEAVGIAPTTAGTHLRKIESRVFGALVR